MKSYLGKRGYVLIKKNFDEKILLDIKNELTVKPYISKDYADNSKPFKVYLENNQKLYIPKYFGIKKFGNPEKINFSEGDNINVNFSGSLREHQIEPVDCCMKAFNSSGGGILSLPCGEGKTACACYMIGALKKKTLVLVHKEFLVNQWIDRILGEESKDNGFLPNSRIGKIQGKIVDIEEKDIVIGMIQSISMKDYPLDTFDSFGFVIIDETHRCPSKEFSKSLQKINSKYMLGLSATPTRKDGLTKVLKWYIGDILFSRKGKTFSNSIVERYIYDCDNEAYCKELNGHYGKINSAGMINQVSEYMPRTEFICSKIKEYTLEKRQILLLSDRKKMLQDIEKIMINNEITCGYYIGGMKKHKLEESTKKTVILATFQMAQEGLDISTIDTIILSTPKTEIEQAVGRIRPKANPNIKVNSPLVIDIVDNFSIFERQGDKRFKFYKKKQYFIETFKVDMNGNNQEKIDTFEPDDSKVKITVKKKEEEIQLNNFSFSGGL